MLLVGIKVDVEGKKGMMARRENNLCKKQSNYNNIVLVLSFGKYISLSLYIFRRKYEGKF